jgi:hypothetical protein
MMTLEVDIGRHCSTTYESVATGLYRAGCMKCVTLIDRGGASDAQVDRLEQHLMGQLIHLDRDERTEDYDTLFRRVGQLEEALAADPEAQKRETAARLFRRVLVLLEVVAERRGPSRAIAREVSREMAERIENDVREYLGMPKKE